MKVCIAGMGKIGVPLAVQFASKGATVVGYDISDARCAQINAGTNPIEGEPGLDEQLPGLVKSGRLGATTDAAESARDADVLIFIVPVDIDASYKPDFEILDAAVDAIAPHIKRGALVIVETTVPVGTTRNRVGKRIEAAAGFAAGDGFRLAFSPERVSSGTVLRDLTIYPKVVGGIDAASTEAARAFYAEMLDAEILVLPDAETAEYSKLVETTYRDVNIALANEFARAGDALGVDTLAAIGAANTQPYSHVHAPGPGVGGHCIPVYPHFISNPELADGASVETPLIAEAREINESMAEYAVDRLEKAMGAISGATAVILGLAYRGGVKESRHSSAFALHTALSRRSARVFVHDPLFSDDEVRALGLEPPPSWPLACDAVVIQAWHAEYAELDFGAFAGLRAVLDTRASVDPARVTERGLLYVGVGRGVRR